MRLAAHSGSFFLAVEPMIVNHQNEIRLDLRATRKFVAQLRRRLRLGRCEFNVCFVEDKAIAALNATYRGKEGSTDVLSFPWKLRNWRKRRPSQGDFQGSAIWEKTHGRNDGGPTRDVEGREFSNFLGDIVISVETARRNARGAGHSVAREIRWLILHGALHLLGYDHKSDGGVMTRLELDLRTKLNT